MCKPNMGGETGTGLTLSKRDVHLTTADISQVGRARDANGTSDQGRFLDLIRYATDQMQADKRVEPLERLDSFLVVALGLVR
jgi:hypothetical protein